MNHTGSHKNSIRIHCFKLFLSCLDMKQALYTEQEMFCGCMLFSFFFLSVTNNVTVSSLFNRSAYKKLLCLLGESGQAEITSLEAD